MVGSQEGVDTPLTRERFSGLPLSIEGRATVKGY